MQSSPASAKFIVKNEAGVTVHSGSTPATIMLKSGAGFFDGETYTMTFEKKGYEPQVITVDTTLDGWYIGNILFGGIIGMLIVDPATGAMWKLPETASASLVEKEGDSLKVVSIDQIPPHMRDQLVKL